MGLASAKTKDGTKMGVELGRGRIDTLGGLFLRHSEREATILPENSRPNTLYVSNHGTLYTQSLFVMLGAAHIRFLGLASCLNSIPQD